MQILWPCNFCWGMVDKMGDFLPSVAEKSHLQWGSSEWILCCQSWLLYKPVVLLRCSLWPHSWEATSAHGENGRTYQVTFFSLHLNQLAKTLCARCAAGEPWSIEGAWGRAQLGAELGLALCPSSPDPCVGVGYCNRNRLFWFTKILIRRSRAALRLEKN